MIETLHASDLREAHSRLRVDMLRRALREGRVEPEVRQAELDEWVQLFRLDPQPGLRALILVALDGTPDPRLDEILSRAWNDRGDGVRLEALRQLLERAPARREELTREGLDDPSLEVQLMAAQALYDLDPERGIDAVVGICARETPGERGSHALRRCSEILAEEFADPRALEGLRRLRSELEDPEEHLNWAIETLESL